MDEALVLTKLTEIHRAFEKDAGLNPNLVSDDAIPLGGLAGFDSPLIPNAIRELAKAVGVPLAKGVRLKNPYVTATHKKLALKDVARRFCQLYGKERRGP